MSQITKTGEPGAETAAAKPRTLTLAVKGVYFDQMVARDKRFEYRLRTPYWVKRLVGRTYTHVCVTKGYPAADDAARRLTVPWQGYEEQVIEHEFFGTEPVAVFAIRIWPDGA